MLKLTTAVAIAGRFLRNEDWPPFLLVLAIAFLELGSNLRARLLWDMPVFQAQAMAAACLLVAIFFTFRHEIPKARETALYMGFWFFYPLFATQLSFITTSAGFALQDKLFLSVDANFGFHWDRWMRFSHSHPGFMGLQILAYSSIKIQSLLTVPILAISAPRERNGEFLTSILLAAGCTIVVSMMFPTLGPAEMFGQHAEQNGYIHALRAGARGPYPPAGIVSFPSFHMVMALLFPVAHRGLRTFWPMAGLNFIMITAIPVVGDHYFSDLIAGAAIAGCAFAMTRWIYGRLELAQQTEMQRAAPQGAALPIPAA